MKKGEIFFLLFLPRKRSEEEEKKRQRAGEKTIENVPEVSGRVKGQASRLLGEKVAEDAAWLIFL